MRAEVVSRRDFLKAAVAVATVGGSALMAAEQQERIIDIHQHTHYSGRSNEQLRDHQKTMGVTTTVLLPAGSKYGLDADCWGNESALALAREFSKDFFFFANEVADLPGATAEIRKYLQRGALGIGEQKFRVACDSPAIEALAELAQEFDVPILMHFQHALYNTSIQNFHRILEKHPKAHFIGHAQTWWGNVDLRHKQEVLYPTGKVTPGGITDRLLADYPNMHGDLSAGSGLNALLRDEENARAFLERHQDKLLFGSDCNDTIGRGPGCQGAQILAAVRRLAPNAEARAKMFHGNAARLFKIKAQSEIDENNRADERN